MLRFLGCGVLAIIGLAALVLSAGYFVLKRDDIPYETLAVRYESAASRYVELPGGVRVHYRDEGAQTEGAPTLLLVHGFSASLQTWEPWVERLGDRYRIVSLDLPGHGLTRAPAGYQANIEVYRDLLAEFVRTQGLEHFVLAGNSMGGNIAWQYALAHPEQVDALVLVDASGWPEENNGEEPQIFQLLRNPIIGPLLRDLDNTRLTRAGLQNAFYDPALVDDAMVNRYVDLARAPGHRDILMQIITGARQTATPELLAPLQEMPVLIMFGDTDRLVPTAHAQLFHDAIPDSQLIILEQTGHVPQEEKPDESAQALNAFLASAGLAPQTLETSLPQQR